MVKMEDYYMLPDEVKKVQIKLSKMPLVPLNPRLRKQRGKTVSKLFELARKHRCISEINPLAGVI